MVDLFVIKRPRQVRARLNGQVRRRVPVDDSFERMIGEFDVDFGIVS